MIAAQEANRGRRGKDASGTAESRGEIAEVKARDMQEMASVVMSAELAIARLQRFSAQNHGANVSNQIAQFQSVESQARSLMSVLSEGKVDLNAIAAAMSNIEGELKADTTDTSSAKDNSAPDAAEAAAVTAPQNARGLEAQLYSAPPQVLQDITQRGDDLDGLRAENAELKQRATDNMQDGKADLVAAVAIAGLLYAGYENRDKIEEAAGKALAKANEYEQSLLASNVSPEEAQVRKETVLKHASSIHEGMQAGQEGAAKALIAAAEQLVLQPITTHMDNAGAHLAHADAHVQKHGKGSREEFGKLAESWLTLREGTLQELGTQLGEAGTKAKGIQVDGTTGAEVYEAMANALGIGKMLKTAENYAEANGKIMESQDGIYANMRKRLGEAEREFVAVATGQSDNWRSVAHKADLNDVQQKDMLAQAAEMRNTLEVKQVTPHYITAGTALDKAGHVAHA